MFRNRGIDYKFPRSAGGRFYSARIDEGRSGILINWGPELVPEVPVELNSELWAWNKTDISEFNAGSIILLGNVTGSVTGSYFSGGTSYGRRTVPSIAFNFSSNFQTPRSGGLALIQVDPGFALPRRYEVQMSYKMNSFEANMFAGIYFGANQITGTSATSSFYASAVIVSEEAPGATPTSFNITTGSIGNRRKGLGSTADGALELIHLRFLVETQATTGSARGPVWKVHVADGTMRGNYSMLHTGYLNETSGTNSTWAGAGNIDRFGIFIGRNASGTVGDNSADTFELQELLIKRHPQDF